MLNLRNRTKSQHRGLWGIALGSLFFVGAGLLLAAAWNIYERVGRTPMELLDYVERRLEGHTKLEWVAAPTLGSMRDILDAPRISDPARRFFVPPPPPRRGLESVLAPDPLPPGAKVWRVGPGEEVRRIADAAQRAQDGDVVEIMAGDYRGDVAVWKQKRLTIRGVGGAARLFADGRGAESKAIWVIRHGDFDISNIDFIGTRVNDGNGAGIRFEGGNLLLRHCLFWDNQTGLLTSGSLPGTNSTLRIVSSEFAYSEVKGRWAHNLYVGYIGKLTVESSYFHHASVGHLLKSRARVNEIRYNRFSDESGGRASYELNFPSGGDVRLVGNIVQQQRRTENGKMVSYGEEGYEWPNNTLKMVGNTFVNDHPHGGSFVYVAPGADGVLSSNNLRAGNGRDNIHAPLTVFNDHQVAWSDFRRPAVYDYALRDPSPELRYQPFKGSASAGLVQEKQYVHPMAVEPLEGAPLYVGANPLGR
ncbi:MAG: hypothetical protein V4794_05970 [Pseudomonadota bacterium]